MTNTETSPSIHRNVVPSEVGWQFVPQYYTFVNKQPDRLHCFYTKKSTFIHGTEGEDGKPCHGQQEIHQKITSLGFQDCKVFIHSVDAQSSADGGIIIQVIGEMSNHGEDWRKFVQTFFLAEQPNGYFVLNDIFRFLKEETVDSDEGEGDGLPAQPAEPAAAATLEPTPAAASESLREPSPSPVPPSTFATAPQALAPTPQAAPEPIPIEEPTTVGELSTDPDPEPVAVSEPPSTTTRPNGISHAQDAEKQNQHQQRITTPAPVAATPVPQVENSSSPAPPASSTATPPPPATVPPPSTTTTTSSTNTPGNSSATFTAAAPAAATPPPNRPVPKTWANLAAANSKKWGSAVAQESRGTTEVVPPSPSGASHNNPNNVGHNHPPNAGQQNQNQSNHPQAGGGPGVGGGGGPGGPGARGSPHAALVQAQTITTAQCFIKGVTEPITQAALTHILTTRFGPLKDLEIVRSKACAFGEFTTIEAARRAIIASLHQAQGGEGGIWIDLPEGGQTRIVVDTKKERGERPPARPRGGGPGGPGGPGGQGGQGAGGNGPGGPGGDRGGAGADRGGGGGSFRGRGRGRGGR